MTDKKAPEIKNLPPFITQTTLRRAGMYCSTYLANDLYYLMSVCDIILNAVGEQWVEQHFARYAEIKPKINKMRKRLMEVKVFYDAIEDKKFSKRDPKRDPEAKLKRFFIKTASKVALNEPELYELFVWLVMNTNIQRMQIPSEAFKILEHQGLRKLTLDQKPGQPQSTGSQTTDQQPQGTGA